MHGAATLSADRTAEVTVREKNVTSPLHSTWDCMAATVASSSDLDSGDEHTIVMDGSEKLIFGYNKPQVPLLCSR